MQKVKRRLGEAGLNGTDFLDGMSLPFKDAATSIRHWALRTGHLPERYVPRPRNDVREGPFYFGSNYTDNAAIGQNDSMLTTLLDPVLLRGRTSATTANDAKLYNQCAIFTGYRLEFCFISSEVDDETKAGVMQDVMATTGLYIKTAPGVVGGFEQYYSAAGAGTTFFSGSSAAVENTNATTAVNVRHQHRVLLPPRAMEPIPVYFKEDTFGLYHGAVCNTQANVKVYAHMEGIVFPWEWSDRRPGTGDCDDSDISDVIFRRLRALRYPTPLLQLG